MHEVCMDSCNCMVCCAVVYDALVACTCMCMCASLHWQTALSLLVSYTEMSSTRQGGTGMDHLPGMSVTKRAQSMSVSLSTSWCRSRDQYRHVDVFTALHS